MFDFTIKNNQLVSFEGNERDVIIPESVNRVCAGAFKGKNVETVKFEGETLKSIDEEAFADCENLKYLLIPNGVVQIGDRAFSGCKSMQYIYIPSSVLLIGDDVLLGHNSDLVIIGETTTEAENIAKHYNVTFQNNVTQTVNAIQAANKSRTTSKTSSFEILGETITCSNTLSKYQAAIEFYSSRKDSFFNSYIKFFPANMRDNAENMFPFMEKEADGTVKRLAHEGVLTNREEIVNKYLTRPYELTGEARKGYNDLREQINDAILSNITSKKEQLMQEAESKITGLSYGIIGNNMDLLLHSIDDYNERKRQRESAYNYAGRQYKEYSNDQINLGEKMLSDSMKEIMPTLRKISDMFIDKLFEAEIDMMTEAGIIEANVKKNVDLQKSAQLMQSVIGMRGDNTFSAVLAVKKYPCNLAALTYVLERNPDCTELKELISFVGLEKQVENSLSSNKENRFKSYLGDLKKADSASQGIAMIQNEITLFTDEEIKKLLNCLAKNISAKVENIAVGEKVKIIKDTDAYCDRELNKTLSQNDFDFFNRYEVMPIVSNIIPHSSTTSYPLLLEWLSAKLSEVMNKKRRYNQYLKEYPLMKEEEETRQSLSRVEKQIDTFKENDEYMREQLPIMILKGLGGGVCLFLGLFLILLLQSPTAIAIAILFFLCSLLFFLFLKPKALRDLLNEKRQLKEKLKEIDKIPPFNENDWDENEKK